jgi:hypothetical protein
MCVRSTLIPPDPVPHFLHQSITITLCLSRQLTGEILEKEIKNHLL